MKKEKPIWKKKQQRQDRHFDSEIAKQVATSDELMGEQRQHEVAMEEVEQASGSTDKRPRPAEAKGKKREAEQEAEEPSQEE